MYDRSMKTKWLPVKRAGKTVAWVEMVWAPSLKKYVTIPGSTRYSEHAPKPASKFASRKNSEPITPVIFRKWPDKEGGEIIALFPYELEVDGNVSSYEHTGQHGTASPEVIRRTKAATPAQYADLKRELEGIGYRLKIIKRWPSSQTVMRSKRRKHRNPGPSAIPAHWTRATVSRKGGQIQIRMGGR